MSNYASCKKYDVSIFFGETILEKLNIIQNEVTILCYRLFILSIYLVTSNFREIESLPM